MNLQASAVLAGLCALVVTLTEGLYSASAQVVVTIAISICTLWRVRAVRLTPWEGVALAGLAASGLLSLARPASADQAVRGAMLVSGWLLAFGLGRNLSGYDRSIRHFGLHWALATSFIVFGGALTFSLLPIHHSHRFTALLGYPVALGILGLVGLVTALPELQRGRVLYAVPIVLGVAAMALSGSRGVFVIACMVASYLLWVAPQLLRPAMLPTLAGLVAGLWAGPPVAAAEGWGLLVPLLLAVLTSLAHSWFHLRFEPWRRYGEYCMLTVGTVALLLAPGWGWLADRAVLVEGSSLERLTLLKDGFALAASHPFGVGYRGWAAMHLTQASYGYYVAEVHSALLDMTISFGWLGGLAFLGLVGSLLWRLPRRVPSGVVMLADQGRRAAVFGGIAALALHGLLDWTLSYGMFVLPLFFGMGLLRSDWQEQLRPASGLSAQPFWRIPGWAARLVAAGTLAAGVPFLASSLALTLGESALKKALTTPRAVQTQVGLLQAERHMRMAVLTWPVSDRAHGQLSQVYRVQGDIAQALTFAERAQALAPFNPWYRAMQGRLLAESGRLGESSRAYREYVLLQPWQSEAYAAALGAHVDLMVQAVLTGDEAQAAEVRASAQELLALLSQKQLLEPDVPAGRRLDSDHPAILEARRLFQ